MFANLKNKLIEEVKASPSKFQQFANAAQAAVSSSTSTTPSGSESTTTTNENFFSITEEDTPQNSPYKPLKLPTRAAVISSASPQFSNNGISSGAIPRTRRLSNSSMASDISFRLPAYESSPSANHLQSDLDISASEVEDSASSMKLETITKEHLYNAYKKSLDRYHKYRCRYTDLAKKYKDLERDSTKARSVLVETQEKAIRRISELREQCALEQQAKAHLEEALRMEMDDMQCKMQAYQTKLKLLGESPEQIAAALASGAAMANEQIALMDLNGSSNEKSNGTFLNAEDDAKTTDGNNTTTQLQQQLVECEMKLQDMTKKYEESKACIDLLRKQEEENALSLAQTKQAIYSEMESKDREVQTLQDAVKRLQNELQNVTKDKPFSAQAKKELEAKIIASDHLLADLREKYSTQEKALSESENNLTSIRKESEQKLAELRQQNSQLNEMIERYRRNEISLAEIDNELNRTKNENDTLKATLQKNQLRLNEMEKEEIELRDNYEQMLNKARLQSEEQLREAESKMQDYVIQLEESRTDQESLRLRVKQLQTDVQIANEQTANTESKTIASLKHEVSSMQEQLSAKENELKACTNKLTKERKQHDDQQAIIAQQTEEIEKLKNELGAHAEHLQSMQLQAKEREEEADREKEALKEKVASILNEITEMEQQMREVQQSHLELEQEKRSLEEKIEEMRIVSQGGEHWQEQLEAAEEKLAQVEEKLQYVETENSQMAEKNCLLVESLTRLERLISERDCEKSVEDEATASDMRIKLKVAEGTIQKLNDKLTQVLDENSRMHNTRELMDHDYRTLQDKCNALEKWKLLAVDTQSCLEQQKQELEEARIAGEAKLQDMSEVLESTKNQLEIEQKKAAEAENEFQCCRQKKQQLEAEIETLNDKLKELKDSQTDEELKLREDLQKQKQLAVDLEMNVQVLQDTQKELFIMEEKLRSAAEELEIRNEELLLLRENNVTLNAEKTQREEEFENKERLLEAIQNQLLSVQQELQSLTDHLENKNKEIKALQLDEQELKDVIQQKQQRIENLESEMQQFSSTERESHVLQEKFQKILEDLEHKNEEILQLREENLHLNEELKITTEDMKQKDVFIEEMQNQQTELKSNQSEEVVQLKEKVTELNEALSLNKQELNALQTKAHELQSTLKNAHDTRERDLQKIKELETLLLQLRETEMQTAEKLANCEQLQIENEYLNKNVHQLEADLEQLKQSSKSVDSETSDLKAKLKSVQCELYVLRESLQKHNSYLEQKQSELEKTHVQLSELKQNSELERAELNRQADHIKYITDQNDNVQKELLHAQQQVGALERNQDEITQELESTKTELKELRGTTASKEDEVIRLSGEIVRNQETIESLQKEVREITAELQAKEELALELSALKVELAEEGTTSKQQAFVEGRNSSDSLKSPQTDSEHLRKLNEILQNELEDLKHKSTTKILNLQQEIEELQSTTNHMTEKLFEYERNLAAAKEEGQHSSSELIPNDISHDRTKAAKEPNDEGDHEAKLKNIMQEVQDVSNRNLFLEQKCENYLILEQSNERLKLQNAKLSRQLDETLVSMQHSEGITANTEFEYLKNIMFQYLTGSATGNNETLVKVISAVLKFSPQQTQVAIEKEHQRRSLVKSYQ